MKKYIIFVVLLIFSSTVISATSHDIKYHVIIDTDAAADDLRAICLLLASDEIEILGIIASDGALSPDSGLIKVQALLKSFGHEGIPVTSGKTTQPAPPR